MEHIIFGIIVLLAIAVLVRVVTNGIGKYTAGKGFLTHGSTYEFKTKDDRAATEHLLEKESAKKFDEQESGEDL